MYIQSDHDLAHPGLQNRGPSLHVKIAVRTYIWQTKSSIYIILYVRTTILPGPRFCDQHMYSNTDSCIEWEWVGNESWQMQVGIRMLDPLIALRVVGNQERLHRDETLAPRGSPQLVLATDRWRRRRERLREYKTFFEKAGQAWRHSGRLHSWPAASCRSFAVSRSHPPLLHESAPPSASSRAAWACGCDCGWVGQAAWAKAEGPSV